MSALIPKEGWNKTSAPTGAANDQPSKVIIRTGLPRTNTESGKWETLRPMLSLLIALAADALDVTPPLSFIGDGLAFISLLAIWGFRWEIAVALIPELIPGISLFPTWSAVVMKLWFQSQKPNIRV